ncbi:MAG: hypothetical protein MHPSP_000929 [Paramarteilia canceri]
MNDIDIVNKAHFYKYYKSGKINDYFFQAFSCELLKYINNVVNTDADSLKIPSKSVQNESKELIKIATSTLQQNILCFLLEDSPLKTSVAVKSESINLENYDLILTLTNTALNQLLESEESAKVENIKNLDSNYSKIIKEINAQYPKNVDGYYALDQIKRLSISGYLTLGNISPNLECAPKTKQIFNSFFDLNTSYGDSAKKNIEKRIKNELDHDYHQISISEAISIAKTSDNVIKCNYCHLNLADIMIVGLQCNICKAYAHIGKCSQMISCYEHSEEKNNDYIFEYSSNE